MKKIAILGLHLNYGGVEQTIINQANALSSDYEVELAITYKMREEPAFPLDSKVNVKYLTKVKPNKEEFKKHIKNRSFIKAFKEGIKSLKILHQKKKTMIEYIENSDADIIISSRVEFAELLGKYKKDNVITITEEHCHHNNNRKYINRLKKACKKIDYLIAVSQELTNFYKKEMPYINCIYMPNSLSTSQTYSSKLNNKNLISVGRLSPEKGYLDLVDMFKILHDKDSSYHLDIIGNGPEYAKINDKIKNLNLESSIKLWGFQSTEFINKKMENSSLYVMCSYEESFGIVLIEAGANGVPSIALDSAKGAMEIIEDEHNGYLIPNRNLELMAEKIDNLMNNPKLLKQFGKNAKEKSNQFTFENIKQNWLNLIPTLNNKKSNVIKYFEKLYNNHVSEFYKIVEKNLELEKRMFIVTSNPETFAYGEKEPEFDKMLLDNDTTLIPDGIGIVKAANMLNYGVKERITGVDLAYKLLELANIHKYKVAIIGATEAVITELKKVIKEKYPNIELLKVENGYVENKDAFFDEISIKQPDVCLVALGIPNQEKLIYKHLKRFKKGIFVGVGGSLDVISGTKKRAPKLFQKLNLEWLYRILKEPKRLKRFYDNNIKFIFKIQKLKKNDNKQDSNKLKKFQGIDSILYLFAYLFFAIPTAIFFMFWYKLYISLPVLLILIIIPFLARRSIKHLTYNQYKEVFNLKKWIIILIAILILNILSGIGGFAFQNGDHNARNAVMHDLIDYEWPVKYKYQTKEEINIIESKEGYLNYYFAYWLPSAAVGKVLGFNAANVMLFIYQYIGLCLFYYFMSRAFKKVKINYLLIFIAFSGLDVIGQFINNKSLLDTISHIDTWSPYFCFSSNITQLFWVFNQGITTWLIMSLLINETSFKNTAIAVMFTLLFSPFPAVGIALMIIEFILFGIYKFDKTQTKKNNILENIKELFSKQNWLCLIVILFIILFFTSNSAANNNGLLLNRYENLDYHHFWLSYIKFWLLEFGILCLINFNTKNKRHMAFNILMLSIIPFYYVGTGGDFVNRVSLPILFFVMLLTIENINNTSTSKFKKAVIILYLCISLVTACHEIKRTLFYTIKVNNFSISKNRNDNWLTYGKINTDEVKIYIKNFSAPYNKDQFQFKYILK